MDYKVNSVIKDEHGNFLILDTILNDIPTVLTVLYGPNKDDPKFYMNILEHLTGKNEKCLIICGDWNNINARKKVQELMETLDLVDTWRCSHPNDKNFSWFSTDKPFKMSRLDFFLVSPYIHAKILRHDISFGYRSDHSFLGITVGMQEMERGKGFGKFNSQLLQHESYIKIVKQVIRDVLEEYSNVIENGTISNQLLLEMVKLTIRRRTIPYCAAKKRKTVAEEKLLEKKISKLEEHICQNISESQKFKLHCELETNKTDLEVLRQAKLTGSMIRSKVNIYSLLRSLLSTSAV